MYQALYLLYLSVLSSQYCYKAKKYDVVQLEIKPMDHLCLFLTLSETQFPHQQNSDISFNHIKLSIFNHFFIPKKAISYS